jgi:hypothetical protein
MKNKLLAIIAALVVASALLYGQQGQAPQTLPLSPTIRPSGQGVTAAYEGWFYNKDGSISLLVGYFNRNQKQELDIPIGPNNRIEPGGPDLGQPTHFLAGRQYGVFAIRVPKNFATQQVTWTLTANGQTNAIPMHTKPDWVVEPFEDAGSRNTPPTVRFEPTGKTVTGPPTGVTTTLPAIVGEPLLLIAWATDEPPRLNVASAAARRPRPSTTGPSIPPPPPLSVAWSKYRGPGTVAFANAKPTIDKERGGEAQTTATFSAPGYYVLRLQANDQSGDGGGGFQCCWTNAYVAVTVKGPAVTTDK